MKVLNKYAIIGLLNGTIPYKQRTREFLTVKGGRKMAVLTIGNEGGRIPPRQMEYVCGNMKRVNVGNGGGKVPPGNKPTNPSPPDHKPGRRRHKK